MPPPPLRRLALIASHPIQYQAPWFRALARAVDLDVLYCHRQDAEGQAAAGFGQHFDWDVPLLDGYAYRFLDNVSPTPGVDAYAGCDTPAIEAVLRDGGFSACLVTGWYLKSFVQAIRAARRLRLPVMVRGDSQLRTPRPLVRRVAKYLPYRWFLSRIDAHLYVGRANREYLRHYGVPERRLFFVPHAIDERRFADGAAAARRDGSAAALRAQHGVGSGDVAFLFVGKLIPKKRPADFVEALGRMSAGRPVHGFILGSGPLEPELRAMAGRSRVALHFLGFQNQQAMPKCYAAADCLVLPSDGGETWGLVVNEAMTCGIPAIVSDAAGSADDLVRHGETGYTFPCGDVAALADRMATIAGASKSARETLGAAAAGHVSRYGIDAAVAGTLAALGFVSRERPAAPAARGEVDGGSVSTFTRVL